ncbi:hypothetical protein KY332_01740 [Candidatus Woesearchaeota archaeon]|nr:hypothetical protein [Candidatus Woesearchaeota archaeon]
MKEQSKIILTKDFKGYMDTIEALKVGIPIVIWAKEDPCEPNDVYLNDESFREIIKKSDSQVLWINACDKCMGDMDGRWREFAEYNGIYVPNFKFPNSGSAGKLSLYDNLGVRRDTTIASLDLFEKIKKISCFRDITDILDKQNKIEAMVENYNEAKDLFNIVNK